MNRQYRENEQLRLQLKSAQAELQALEKMLVSFENQVEARLGDLLDQLSDLNAEAFTLDQELRGIREQRLFGEGVIRYLDGAPRPVRPLNVNDLPPMVLQPQDEPEFEIEGETIYPNVAAGIEIGTSTHAFRVFVSNYNAIIKNRSIAYNTNNPLDGDFQFGFNISVRF